MDGAQKMQVNRRNTDSDHVGSGLFNINEPTMFGIPVVLNILLLNPVCCSAGCKPDHNLLIHGIRTGTADISPGWTTPPVISGFLATGSIRASILQIILVVGISCYTFRLWRQLKTLQSRRRTGKIINKIEGALKIWKRLISANTSEMLAMNAAELEKSIKASEGSF